MKSNVLASVALVLGACAFAACSSANTGSGFDNGGGGGGGGGGGSDGGGAYDGNDDVGSIGHVTDGGVDTCVPSPANYDIPGNKCDDDGNGQVDDTPTCDTGLAQAGDGIAFAKSIGLCQQAAGSPWGIVSA